MNSSLRRSQQLVIIKGGNALSALGLQAAGCLLLEAACCRLPASGETIGPDVGSCLQTDGRHLPSREEALKGSLIFNLDPILESKQWGGSSGNRPSRDGRKSPALFRKTVPSTVQGEMSQFHAQNKTGGNV